MIKLVSRITLWGVVLLALTGCFQTLDSPIAPSPTPQGGAVAVQPTVALPTETPLQQPTVAVPTADGGQPTLEGQGQPTLEVQPTLDQTAQFPPTDIPPVVTDIPTQPTVASVGTTNPQIQSMSTLTPFPTMIPTTQIPPTNVPPTNVPPTNIPPTETPMPSPTPTLTDTPSPASLVTNSPTPTMTGTVRTAPTIAPPQDGAMGTIDADCTYHVEQDDRLYRISVRFNRTITELRLANPSIVNTDLIYLGQTLRIPECNIR